MKSDKDIFKILLLIARPAAGKSEIIDYLKKLDPEERRKRFHIGRFEVIDDFPMIWTWFEEDRILTEMGKPPLHTTEDGYFKEQFLWDLLIRRICLEYKKKLCAEPDYHDHFTTIIEFSRGIEHGGYAGAFEHLSGEVLERSALLYINVSYEESMRKNRTRFNPDKPYTILEHSLPDDKMERLYRENDWEALSAHDPEYLKIQAYSIPYTVFENEDDVTSAQGEALDRRLEKALSKLWRCYSTI